MDTLIAQIKLMNSEMATRLVPLIIAAVLTYIVVYLFFHKGPLQSLRSESALKRRSGARGQDESIDDFIVRTSPRHALDRGRFPGQLSHF